MAGPVAVIGSGDGFAGAGEVRRCGGGCQDGRGRPL